MATGGEVILRILASEGVTHVFGNPGTTELPLLAAVAGQEHIRYVLALQESTVLAMAGGHALASRGLTAALLHAAPGLGNAMGMLYDAARAGAPLLVLAGQHEQSFAVTEPVLWADLPRMAEPVCKWSTEVRRADDLPRILRRAAKVAMTAPTGPVFLSIPFDVMTADVAADLGQQTRIIEAGAAPAAVIDGIVDRLVAAAAPVIVAGDGMVREGGEAALATLASQLQAPVFTECIANTTPLDPRHPLARGPLPRLAPQVRSQLAPHDLILSLGGDLFTLSLPSDVDPMPSGMTVIHLDDDPWELGKNYPAAIAVRGDLVGLTTQIAEALVARQGPRAVLSIGTEAPTPADSMQDFYRALGARLPAGTVIAEEAISLARGVREHLVGAAGDFFGLRGGGIGWGIAAAVGIKLARPDRPLLAVIGDGSALYNVQALWTAARERLGLVILILDNRGYAILDQRSGNGGGLGQMTALADPAIDWLALAGGFGVRAIATDSFEVAIDSILDGLDRPAPTLVALSV